MPLNYFCPKTSQPEFLRVAFSSSKMPQSMFRTHEAIMRTILATACWQIVQHLFVQQAGTCLAYKFMLYKKISIWRCRYRVLGLKSLLVIVKKMYRLRH